MKNLEYVWWKNRDVIAGPQWGIPELWWHDAAEVNSVGCHVNVDTVSAQRIFIDAKLEDGSDFGEFDLRFWWEGEVEEGYWYRLQMRFGSHENMPDLFLYNGAVIWDKNKDYDPTEGNEPRFYFYATSTGIPQFDMITRLDKSRPSFTLLPPHQGDYQGVNMTMPRAEGEKGEEPPRYEFPEYTVNQRCPKNKSSRMFYYSYQNEENPTVEGLPEGANVSDVKIYEHEMYPTRRNAYILSDLKFDGVVYFPTTYDEKADFIKFFEASNAQGMKTLIMLPVMAKKLFDSSCGDGDYAFSYLSDYLDGKNHFLSIKEGTFTDIDKFIDMGLDSTTFCMKYWLDHCEGGRVMLVYPEIPNSLGAYVGGISKSNIANLDRYKDILRGGRIAYEKVFEFFREMRERIDSRMKGYEGRYTVFSHNDYGAYNQAVTQSFSVEGCFGKNGNRGSGNVVLANSRGNAHSYGNDYGFVFDAWDRLYWFNHCSDGITHGLLSIFFGGCKTFTDEIFVEDHHSENITKWGETWYDFVRFAKVHPSLGEPLVKFGVMRGLGDEWQRLAGDSAGWEAETEIISIDMHYQMLQFAPTNRWRKAFNKYQRTKHVDVKDSYYNDYELLNVPFCDYGHSLRTDPEKHFTGTPYGPCNFVAWNAPVDKLCDYDLISYFGRGVGTTKQDIENLEEYVRRGGTLIIAAGQLQNDKDEYDIDSFCGVRLGETRKLDCNLFTELSGGRVLYELCNKQPFVVENSFGKGKVILFAGQFLTDICEETAKTVLRGCLDEIKAIEFSAPADHIEYCFTKFGNGWLLPLLNQGRGVYPSGNGIDHGVYKATLKIDLERLGLSGDVTVRELKMPLDGKALPTYSDYNYKQEGNTLILDVEVDRLCELVIEPK